MTSFGQGNNHSKSASQKPINPFAGSLLENEQKIAGSASSLQADSDKVLNPFANALLNNADGNGGADTPESLQKRQAEALLAQKKDALRKKLHDKVNPTNTHELYSAQEERSKEELNQVRRELELLIADVKDLDKEISMAVSQDVVTPGLDGGTYYRNFFHQLRQLIMLLRQKVGSARSWASQMQVKGKKKHGLNYKTTKGVQSSINNERNAGANAVG